jgi:hypothetical protein
MVINDGQTSRKNRSWLNVRYSPGANEVWLNVRYSPGANEVWLNVRYSAGATEVKPRFSVSRLGIEAGPF